MNEHLLSDILRDIRQDASPEDIEAIHEALVDRMLTIIQAAGDSPDHGDADQAVNVVWLTVGTMLGRTQTVIKEIANYARKQEN